MNIRIDRETGTIIDQSFVIQPGLGRGLLRSVQPKTFRPPDQGVIRVAESRFDDELIGIFAHDRDGGIEVYVLTAFQSGDSWDNYTAEKQEARRRTYRAILATSGIGNKQMLPWGHAEIVFDPKNVTDSLWVVHRAASPP